MYEKAEITLVGGEVKVMKSILKRKITTLKGEGHHYKAQIYIGVLNKIVEATKEPSMPTTRNTDHIKAGREFYNLHPLDQTHLLVVAYDGGDRVNVTDTNGKRPRSILASSLRPSATKPNGEKYKTGYAPA